MGSTVYVFKDQLKLQDELQAGDYVVLNDWSIVCVRKLEWDALHPVLIKKANGDLVYVKVDEILGWAKNTYPESAQVEWWPEGNQDQAVVGKVIVAYFESSQLTLDILGEGKTVQAKNVRPKWLEAQNQPAAQQRRGEPDQAPRSTRPLWMEASQRMAEVVNSVLAGTPLEILDEPKKDDQKPGVWAVFMEDGRGGAPRISTIWETQEQAMAVASKSFKLMAKFVPFGEP